MSAVNKKRNIFFMILEALFSIYFTFRLFVPQYKVQEELLNSIDFYKLYFYKNLHLVIVIGMFLIMFIKIVSIFLSKHIKLLKRDNFFSVLLNILNSGVICTSFGFYIINFAGDAEFFKILPYELYISITTAFIYNIIYLIKLIRVIFTYDPSYKDYKHMLTSAVFKEIPDNKKIIKNFISIRQKIIFSFIAAMLIIETFLSYMILQDYRQTILDAVKYTGITLSEQSASFFKENITDQINLDMYIKKEGVRNENSDFQYDSLTFYMRQPRVNKFSAVLSTNHDMLERELPEDVINEYSKKQISSDFYKDNEYHFISPVVISNITVGFSVVVYKEKVIYRPFFKALIRVIILTVVVMYISLFFIIYFGNRIVFPILYLQINVKSISNILLNMINGKSKKSANLLNYYDKVRSRDEIKSLSLAVDEMVKVIRGIIPYVSASTLTYSDKQGDKSVKTEMAFLFTDIRGFTTMCEGMSPDEVVNILNSYLNLQADIILENHGDIDKFVGDEIMASFDGAEKELNACKAAWAISQKMEEEKKNREKEGKTVVSIGIGINSGTVVFGNVGAQDRMDFTSIGDTVNLAARLEGTNKEYKTTSLITEIVYDKVKDFFVCREIDLVAVKGKSKPVRIYEIIAEKSSVKKDILRLKDIFEEGLELYRNQIWEKALEKFSEAENIYGDKTSRIFINRIEHFKHNPPASEWDGVFAMTVK